MNKVIERAKKARRRKQKLSLWQKLNPMNWSRVWEEMWK